MERFFDINHASHNFFDYVFADMRRMETEMEMMRRQMFQLLPHDLMSGTLDSEIHPRVPIVQERGENKLKLEFNVQDFRPEEVKVKILGDNILQVRAEHEEKSEAGDMKRRLYVRQYSLPKGVDVEHVRPTLTKDGVLTIEATTSSAAERLIPIEFKGDEQPAVKHQ